MKTPAIHWLTDLGGDALSRVYRAVCGDLTYGEPNDIKVAEHLQIQAFIAGVETRITASVVASARQQFGLVAFRSPKAPVSPSPQVEIPVLSAAAEKTSEGGEILRLLGRLDAHLDSIASAAWAYVKHCKARDSRVDISEAPVFPQAAESAGGEG